MVIVEGDGYLLSKDPDAKRGMALGTPNADGDPNEKGRRVVVVTSNAPLVKVSAPAIPNVALEPSCSFVPLSVTLNKFAVPEKIEVPLNVAVFAVEEKLPATDKSDATEKLFVVEMLPGMVSA